LGWIEGLLRQQEHHGATLAVHAGPAGALWRAFRVDELESQQFVKADGAAHIHDVQQRREISGLRNHVRRLYQFLCDSRLAAFLSSVLPCTPRVLHWKSSGHWRTP